MKNSVFVTAVLILACAISGLAGELSVEKEQQLLELLQNWGTPDFSASLSGFFGYQPVKCATPEILAIRYYVEDASSTVQQAYETYAQPRPETEAPYYVDSPGGQFRIHFAKEGPHAALGAEPGQALPDYVWSVAKIFDSVWTFETGSLGFVPPPSDSFYANNGGSDRYDVYLVDMVTLGMGEVYGYTVPEEWIGRWTGERDKYLYTSYMAVDNDFQEIDAYKDRPLDAVRVTAAHEFFHAIQFGYDAWEFEIPYDDDYAHRTHWMEMSSVWMEEQAYDYVNDYRWYLPHFFANVHLSLRTAHLAMFPAVVYQYAAVVWPLYLSKTFGRDIVRAIWDRCAEDPGPNVFQNAFEDVIVDVSGGTYDFRSALSEFYVWSFFTGDRAIEDFAFSEAEFYPQIPDSQYTDRLGWQPYIQRFSSFPVSNDWNLDNYAYVPDYLGANYLKFQPVRLDSTLRMVFHGEERRIKSNERDTIDFHWAIRVAGVGTGTGSPEVELDPTIYTNHDTVVVDEPLRFSEIIVMLLPYADTKPCLTDQRRCFIHEDVAYQYSVIDTTAPIAQTVFFDPYPNPLEISEWEDDNPRIAFKVIQQGDESINMDVFTLAGEKVIEKRVANSSFVYWDGRNESGELVASGIYLVSIRVADESKIFKVAIIE